MSDDRRPPKLHSWLTLIATIALLIGFGIIVVLVIIGLAS